jgi:deoxyribonuclease-4
MIRFGPAGIGGKDEAISNLEKFSKLGLKACEIAFTYGVYLRIPKLLHEIKQVSQKLDVKLSIHAPYWINLNSKEKRKIEESKKRILDCCKIGNDLGARKIVFHAGFYGKRDKETSYQNIKKAILEMQKIIKKNKWKVELCPETMGKINVFGDVPEILRLVKETKCDFCLDFAHLYARNLGKKNYKELYEPFKQFKQLHCHFSGIVFGEKGERSHKLTGDKELKELLSILPKNKEIVIINESPNPIGDSVKSLKIYNKNK